MDLTHAIALLITVLMLGVATKIGAIAVSAPNSSYAIVLIYTAFSIMIYLMTELIGLQRRPQFFSPLFSLSGFWFFACVLGLLILKFVVTMRLFDIGKLRALCLMIAITVLVTLTARVHIWCKVVVTPTQSRENMITDHGLRTSLALGRGVEARVSRAINKILLPRPTRPPLH